MRAIILIFTFFTFTTVIKSTPVEPKLEQPKASQAEINEYLFGSPNATYLTDFENGLSVRLDPADAPQLNMKRDIKFVFQSKQHPQKQIFTFNTRASLDDYVVNPTKPLRVIIHGWSRSMDAPVNILITDAYMEKQDVNVMIVDWEKPASENYFVARELAYKVGNIIALMLQYLVKERKLAKLETTYIIGHSLGAHIAGFARKALQDFGVGKVAVIFALDAAGPLFSYNEPEKRIAKDDAEYVVALHTASLLGFTQPIGHADFYANYGFVQPGCDMDIMRSCSHLRPPEYFAEAIQSDTEERGFWAVKCDSVYEDIEKEKCRPTSFVMKYGEILKEKPTGIFYFETNQRKPFAKGKASIDKFIEKFRAIAATTPAPWKWPWEAKS